MEFEVKEDLYKKGKKALDVGRLDEAEAFFQQILAEEPDDPDTLNKMGVIEIYRKNTEKALEYFNHALDINPEHSASLCNLGNLELEIGNMNKAEMMYRQAIRFDPQYGPAHNNLAFILKKTGRVTEAVQHMKKAQKAGTISFDLESKKAGNMNKGCLTIIVLTVIAIVLWLITSGR